MLNPVIQEPQIRSEFDVESLAQVGIWEEVEGKDTFWSEHFFKLYGLDSNQLSPSARLRKFMMNPADLRRYQTKFEKLLLVGEHFSTTARILRADGSVRRLMLRVSKAESAPTGTNAFTGVAVDITDIFELSAAIEESSLSPLDAIFHHPVLSVLSQDVLLMIANAAGEVIFANAAFLEYWGFSPSEVIGSNFRFLDIGFRGHEFLTGAWRSIVAGEKWSGIISHKRRDRTTYRTEATITPLTNESGNTEFAVFLLSDADRAEYQDRVLESSIKRLQAVLELGELSCLYLDPITLAISLSDEFKVMLGIDGGYADYTLEAFVHSLVAEDDRTYLLQMASSFRRAGQPDDCERQIVVKFLGANGAVILAKVRLVAGPTVVFGIVKKLN